MDMFPKYSLLLPARSKNPQEVWGVLCGGWLGTLGPPKCPQMGEGGEWKNAIWTDLCAERRIKVQFRGVGAHPWLLERRNGPARGIYNRLVEDDRFSKKMILLEAQWCLNTMLSACRFSAHQMVLGSNPVDLCGWEDKDEDLMFAQDTSLAGRLVQQWELRMRAQEATLKEIARSKLRRLLAYSKSFNCADIADGDDVPF